MSQYLQPLAAIPELAPHIRLNSCVTRIARAGYDKMKTPGRESAPFALRVRGADGDESTLLARAVIDASGTWSTPNPLGDTLLTAPLHPEGGMLQVPDGPGLGIAFDEARLATFLNH